MGFALPAWLNRRSPHRVVTPAQLFDAVAARFEVDRDPVAAWDEEAVGRLLPPLPGRRVLDLGCGTARHARAARDAGAASVVAMDVSAAMLRQARSLGLSAVARADLRQLPCAPGRAEVVVCALTPGFVRELPALVGEVARVLGPGGVAVLSDLHPAGASLGWRRDFATPDGERLEAPWTPHTRADYECAAAAAGLAVDAVVEIPVHPPSRPGPDPAATARFVARFSGRPVILALRLSSPLTRRRDGEGPPRTAPAS